MDERVILVVLAMVFATVIASTQGIVWFLQRQREQAETNLRRRLGLSDTIEVEDDPGSSLIREQTADSALAWLGAAGSNLSRVAAAAGDGATVTGLVIQMAIGGALLGGLGLVAAGGFGAIGVAPGALIPYWLMSRRGSKRAAALLAQMPDSLELMARSMQAGAGLNDAFKNVAEEMPEPVGREFGLVFDEVRFGKDWRDALGSLVARNPLIFELRLMSSSLLLQRETGGNLIETLVSISRTIRNRYVFDAKVKGMTSEARSSGIILAAVPCLVVGAIAFFNFDYLRPLWETTAGNWVMLYCFCSYAIGIYLMIRVSAVEV